jgi:trigger factor
MNITQEKIDDLNAIIKIKLTPEDYTEQYKKKLNEHRKKVTLPGFRPGHAPIGVIKKKYGQSILADELNSIINEKLYTHIRENKLNVLGNPLPSDEHTTFDKWEEDSDFVFGYKIGLAPDFELKLSKKDKVPFYKIKVDEETIDKQIADFAKRYGKMVPADKSQADDMVYGEFTQLDEKGNILEGGIIAKSTISIPLLEDEKAKKELIGLKQGDIVVVDPKKVSKGDVDMAAMLHIKTTEVVAINTNFQFQVVDVKRLEGATIDQELFDKIVGKDSVKNEKDFRAKVAEDMEKAFVNDSDRLFEKSIAKTIIDKLKLPLPDAFLKDWIVKSNDKPVTAEQIEGEYEQYAKQLKWQLIENKVIRDNDIKVELEEAKDYIKGLLVQQYAQYNMPAPEEKQLEDNINNVLQNQDETKKIFDYLYKNKVTNFFKENLKVEDKEVSQEDFIKLFYEN